MNNGEDEGEETAEGAINSNDEADDDDDGDDQRTTALGQAGQAGQAAQSVTSRADRTFSTVSTAAQSGTASSGRGTGGGIILLQYMVQASLQRPNPTHDQEGEVKNRFKGARHFGPVSKPACTARYIQVPVRLARQHQEGSTAKYRYMAISRLGPL